jgi:hypothetical protein
MSSQVSLSGQRQQYRRVELMTSTSASLIALRLFIFSEALVDQT